MNLVACNRGGPTSGEYELVKGLMSIASRMLLYIEQHFWIQVEPSVKPYGLWNGQNASTTDDLFSDTVGLLHLRLSGFVSPTTMAPAHVSGSQPVRNSLLAEQPMTIATVLSETGNAFHLVRFGRL